MDHFIDHIEIKNFKSIRHLEVGGFKRINLFIGRPNVGKSNILEALSLFSLPYLYQSGNKKITDIVRLSALQEIFYEGEINSKLFIEINSNGVLDYCYVQVNVNKSGLIIGVDQEGLQPFPRPESYFQYSLNSQLKLSKAAISGNNFSEKVKKYKQ